MRIILILLGLFSSLTFHSGAQAAWSASATAGSAVVVDHPSCGSTGGKVVCAAQAFVNVLAVNVFNGTTWTGWTNLPTIYAVTDPSCTDDGATNVVCVVRASSGYLVATVYNGTTFSGPISSPDRVVSKPSCAALVAGTILCAARSQSGGLVSMTFNGTVWSASTSIATTATSAPSCASDSGGNVICIFLGSTRTMRTIRYDGTAWSAQLDMGVWLSASDPVCTSLASSGRVLCFLHWENGFIYANEFVGGAWQISNWSAGNTWTSAISGGTRETNFSCAATGARRAVCAVLGKSDGALYATEFNAGSFSSPVKAINSIVSNPACGSHGANVGVCVGIAPNNRLSYTTGP